MPKISKAHVADGNAELEVFNTAGWKFHSRVMNTVALYIDPWFTIQVSLIEYINSH